MSIKRGTKITNAQRQAQNRYEAKTYKVVGCKMPKDLAEQFIAKAESDPAFYNPKLDKGSVNAALLSFIEEYMKNE